MSHEQLQNDSATAIKTRLFLLHAACLFGFIYPPTWPLIWLAIISFSLRMFGVEGAYHRYFSHRAFQTGRIFQFILALLATSSGQRGIISWAATHRKHHRYSDTDQDPHSPIVNSFWHAHLAWIWNDQHRNPEHKNARDLTKFPELVFLNRHHYIATYGLILALFLLGQFTDVLGAQQMGIDAIVWGFLVPTLATFHMTMSINSVFHFGKIGSAPFNSNDASRNVWWLAIPSLGASWHNNHHYYGSAARAGIHWWQIDLAYYAIRLLGVMGLVWNIREFPKGAKEYALEGETPLGRLHSSS